MLVFRKCCLGLAALAFVGLLAGLVSGDAALWRPSAVMLALTLAIGIGALEALKSYQYTVWILVAVVAAMIYPARFLQLGGLDLRNKWLVLLVVQMVMFGMGTQMSLRDFRGVVQSPRGVIVAVICHFTIMPLVGFGLTRLFTFPPEIAAGIILIGSCSAGLASNVMAYIARANLALSVTATAVSTLVSPLMTPLMMKLLAGTLVEVRFADMMMEIVKIVIVPIGAALLHDYLKNAAPRGRRIVLTAAGASAAWMVFLAAGGWSLLARTLPAAMLPPLATLGFFLGAVIAGVLYNAAAAILPRLDAWMPRLSMAGIVYFTTVTTAAGRDNLLQVGALLFLASVLHNSAGYFLGYWLSRGAGLDQGSARAVAFEVGLQNGGMASGLAGAMGKLSTVGLAAAIFSPWMNISGSILANFWRRRPPPSQP
jgi:BASS family bile acid:Na+ symporter